MLRFVLWEVFPVLMLLVRENRCTMVERNKAYDHRYNEIL